MSMNMSIIIIIHPSLILSYLYHHHILMVHIFNWLLVYVIVYPISTLYNPNHLILTYLDFLGDILHNKLELHIILYLYYYDQVVVFIPHLI